MLINEIIETDAAKTKKDAEKNLAYRIGRYISRLLKQDPDYDPYDQRDKEVKSFKPKPKTAQSSIYEPSDMEKIRAELGARYGLTARDVLKYSVADEPLGNLKQFSPDKYKAVQAFRKDYPPAFNSYGEPVKKEDANVFKKGAASANQAAHTATAMHSKIDARLKNTPSIAKTKAFKDYEKGNQQRKIKAMKQGMPYGRQDKGQ